MTDLLLLLALVGSIGVLAAVFAFIRSRNGEKVQKNRNRLIQH